MWERSTDKAYKAYLVRNIKVLHIKDQNYLPFSWSTEQQTRNSFLYIQTPIDRWCNTFG